MTNLNFKDFKHFEYLQNSPPNIFKMTQNCRAIIIENSKIIAAPK